MVTIVKDCKYFQKKHDKFSQIIRQQSNYRGIKHVFKKLNS